MNIKECGALLGLMAAYDYRDVDPVIIAAWLKAIGDISYADAEAAVLAYYGKSRERIMPADVRDRVKAMRLARLQNTPLAGRPPAGALEYAEWLRAGRKRIADGTPARPALEGS